MRLASHNFASPALRVKKNIGYSGKYIRGLFTFLYGFKNRHIQIPLMEE
jgi:hypothetical protein